MEKGNLETEQSLGPVSEALLLDSERITPAEQYEVRRLRLRVDDPAFRCRPGQMIGIVVPGPHPFGNPYHMRRYSVADTFPLDNMADGLEFELLVRRCFGVDDFSGERYPGIASNYLCDARTGQRIAITGPFRSPFQIPGDEQAKLMMVGTGTGVAPFRALVREIHLQRGGWRGQVRIYYGSHSGVDLLYRNDPGVDLANYYDEASFKAFNAVAGRPLISDAELLTAAVDEHAADIWAGLQLDTTHLYLAGLHKTALVFDKIMSAAAGSAAQWHATRSRMQAEGRWSELLYH